MLEVGGRLVGKVQVPVCKVQGARSKVQPSTWVVESVRLSGGWEVGR